MEEEKEMQQSLLLVVRLECVFHQEALYIGSKLLRGHYEDKGGTGDK